MRKRWGIVAGLVALSGCNQAHFSSNDRPVLASITAEGAADQTDNYTFESLNQKSFRRTQKYVAKSKGEDAPKSGILVARITQVIGKRKEAENDGFILIRDGRGEYDCSYYYTDIPKDRPDSDVSDPVCKFEIVGFARLVPAQLASQPAT